jgi:glycine cleavage system regulatory protein
MDTPLVMTLIGQDRPGLVEMVARLVADHGGNWLESRMCRLGGKFAGLLRVEVPSEQEAALGTALAALERHGLSVVVHPDRAAVPAMSASVRIDLVGQDRPGIVREIAAVLAARGVNVEELTTERCSAPMSGEALFKAQALLLVPEGSDLVGLRREIERIAADLLVEIEFIPLAPRIQAL